MWTRGLLVGLLLAPLVGCTETSGDATAPTDVVTDVGNDTITASTTYHGHARPILDQRCVICHQSGGGAPFPMGWNPDEWSEGPAWWATMAMNAIAEGRMPPWSPTEDCRSIQHARSLSQEERAVLEAWQAEGFALGDPSASASTGPPVPEPIPDPDLVADAGAPYKANSSKPDDYRCFLLDTTFDVDRYATRTDVWPGAREVVHHVILYRLDSEAVSEVEALDAIPEGSSSASELGYSCFGGPGVNADFIGAWVPGAQPFAFPEGAAVQIPAGSRIVMQLHYNTAYLQPESEVPEDLTQMALWLLPEGETPQDLLYFRPFANGDIFIPANDPGSAHVLDETVRWNSHIVGVAPHMHGLGTEIRGSIVNTDDASSCLFDIPAWDFNWQQLYMFEEGEELFVHGLSRHRMTCIYDNSPENQPVINGVQSDPKNVTWGDGTADEMCLNYALLKYPFAGTQHSCGNYGWCLEKCDDDFACAYGCSQGSGDACGSCLSDAYVDCATEHCPAELQPAGACAQECANSGQDLATCLLDTCGDSWQNTHDCVWPLMLSEACEVHFGPCDLGP